MLKIDESAKQIFPNLISSLPRDADGGVHPPIRRRRAYIKKPLKYFHNFKRDSF